MLKINQIINKDQMNSDHHLTTPQYHMTIQRKVKLTGRTTMFSPLEKNIPSHHFNKDSNNQQFHLTRLTHQLPNNTQQEVEEEEPTQGTEAKEKDVTQKRGQKPFPRYSIIHDKEPMSTTTLEIQDDITPNSDSDISAN